VSCGSAAVEEFVGRRPGNPVRLEIIKKNPAR
jgi:hypothetical protein